MSMIETVARAIASAMGDNFADAFKNKARWIAKRGMSGGRFRDVNEPFQHDYLDAARAAIAAMQGEPVAYLHQHPEFGNELDTLALQTADKADGWTETPLYALPPAPEVSRG